jgi:hypothetical protein
VTSPLAGFAIALALMVAVYWLFHRADRRPLARIFRRLQVFSAGYMAFAHGSNDAQKTMGIITLALFAAGAIPTVDVPPWVIVIAATAISLGTAVGGWRIMKTMGQRVVELEPVSGFAAETTAATGLDDPRHLERDHGRRVQSRHARRPLGRRRNDPRRLDPDDPRNRDRRRGDLCAAPRVRAAMRHGPGPDTGDRRCR